MGSELAVRGEERRDAFVAYESDPSIENAVRLVKAQRNFNGNWPGNDFYTPIMDRVLEYFETDLARLRAELAAATKASEPVCNVIIYAAVYESEGVNYLRGTWVKKESAELETERQRKNSGWKIIECHLVRADGDTNGKEGT